MKSDEDLTFLEKVNDFRRSFFNRMLIALCIVVWLVGSIILLLQASFQVFGFVVFFCGLCFVSYQISQHSTFRLGEVLLVFGALLFLYWMIDYIQDPFLIVVSILFAFLSTVLLSRVLTVIVIIALVIGQLIAIFHLAPEIWMHWQMLVLPLTTILAAVIAYLRETDFYTILSWANTSIHYATDRLDEVREHRAKLFRLVKDLDDANHRLERMNEMLVSARAEAEQARQARNQFALTVSHELRTPLGFIIGFSEVMINSPESYGGVESWPPGLYDDVNEIYRSSQHLSSLLNDVLDLGKADADRLILAKEITPPAQIFLEVENILHEAVLEKQLWLRFDFQDKLPDLYLDRTRIRQVLINLISNSLRFTEQGGITVSAKVEQNHVLFSVCDTGPGIAEDEIEKVFQEFGQAATTVWRRRDGSGLGIPISKRFVELHGGEMWVKSKIGQGTCFSFTIPLPGAYTRQNLVSTDGEEAYWKFKQLETRTSQLVLVLCTDADQGRVIKNLLDNFVVDTVEDCESALHSMLTLQPRAILIDSVFKNMAETTSLLDNLPYDLPVFFLKLPGSHPKVKNLPEGIVHYLPKPVLREDLQEALQSAGKTVKRIWVIDDEEAMVRFVQLSVNSLTITTPPVVISSGTGQEVTQKIIQITGGQEPIPDVILLDLTLPDTSGWALLPQLRQHFRQANLSIPPVILVTAATLEEELDSQERKRLEVSTMHTLAQDELSTVLKAMLQTIGPKLIPGQNGPGRQEMPSEK